MKPRPLHVMLNLEFSGLQARRLVAHCESRRTTPKQLIADLILVILRDDMINAVLDDGRGA